MVTYRIVLSYAVFSIDIVDSIVTDTAPIAYWMKGKSIDFVKRWVAEKKGSIDILHEVK